MKRRRIDGAGKVKAFFHITMPMMKNVSFVCTILMFIWTINNFENIYLMTQDGPLDSTMILRYSPITQRSSGVKWDTPPLSIW